MTDPKMALTKLSQVFAARRDLGDVDRGGPRRRTTRGARRAPDGLPDGAGGPGAAYPDLAAELAARDAIIEDEAGALARAREEFSISTVEELVALALVDRREHTRLVGRTGIPVKTVQRLVREYGATPVGRDELADWSRYDRLEYRTGCAIDLDRPPPDATLDEDADVDRSGRRAGALPEGIEVNLIDEHMSPVRDQARRGTCTAFAAIACLEYHLRRFGGQARPNLSEQFAYWNMVRTSGQHALAPMFTLLAEAGVCTERAWPYYGEILPDSDDQGPPPPRAEEGAPANRPGSVRKLAARSVARIRGAILEHHPVAVAIPVFASWFQSSVVRKFGNITVPLPDEVPERVGHAVTLVGFDDNPEYAGGGYFIVRNSWDGNWATEGVFGQGYGTIPYRYIQRHNWDAWYVAS